MEPDRDEYPFSLKELDGVYHRVENTLASRTKSRRPVKRFAAVGVLFAAAACVALWAYEPAGSGPLRMAGTSEALPDLEPDVSPVVLSDGSQITLAQGARLSTLENSSTRFRVLLSPGTATFDVVPGGPRTWSIDAGEFVVDVIGTQFTVERAASYAEVRVERGEVRVRGNSVEGGFQRLRAGMNLRIEWVAQPAESQTTAGSASSDLVDRTTPHPGSDDSHREAEMPSVSNPTTNTRPRAASRTRPWRELADEGQYEQAYAQVEEVFRAEIRRAQGVASLFRLADTARLSGHPSAARSPLERIVNEHPSDSRAGLAAFTLAKIESESMARPEHARRWFLRALQLGLSPSLVRATHRRLAALETSELDDK